MPKNPRISGWQTILGSLGYTMQIAIINYLTLLTAKDTGVKCGIMVTVLNYDLGGPSSNPHFLWNLPDQTLDPLAIFLIYLTGLLLCGYQHGAKNSDQPLWVCTDEKSWAQVSRVNRNAERSTKNAHWVLLFRWQQQRAGLGQETTHSTSHTHPGKKNYLWTSSQDNLKAN